MPIRKKKDKKTPEDPKNQVPQEVSKENTLEEAIPEVPEVLDSSPLISEEEARSAVHDGAFAMQHALFTHARFTGGRLYRVRSILEKIETKIFDDTFIEDLEKKEMLKLYELVKGTERDSLDYLERTHKIIQDSPNVVKVTQTFVSNRPHRGATSISERIDRNLISQIKQRLLTDTAIAQEAIAEVMEMTDDTIDISEDDQE